MQNQYPLFDGSQLCAQTDPELWFPTADRQTGRVAKVLCNKCPWRESCLQYALFNDVMGIWGGKTERERSQIRKKQKIKVSPLYLDTLFLPSPKVKLSHQGYNEAIDGVVHG